MPYGDIVSRAFAIWWRHKYLWLLGALAGGARTGGPGFNSFNFPGSLGRSGGNNTPAPFPGQPQGGYSGPPPEFVTWFQDHWWLLIVVAAAFLLLTLVLLVVSCIAAPGLIEAAAWHDGEADFSFGRAWRSGRTFFWRFLGLRLVYLVVALAAIAVFAVLIVLTFVAFAGHAAVVGALLVLVDVVVAFVLFFGFLAAGIVGQLASIALVLERLGVRSAIGRGIERFRHRLGRVLLVWLIQIAMAIGAGIAIVAVYVPVIAILVGGGVAAYQAGIGALVGYIVAAVIVFIAISWVIGGIVGSYFMIYWTLAYRRLDLEQRPPWMSGAVPPSGLPQPQ